MVGEALVYVQGVSPKTCATFPEVRFSNSPITMGRINMQRAFSLVELSIVLVILGLLAGGILAGKSLIRAAELRTVTSEYSRYKTAVGAFKDKYFYLPGDIPNATAVWGTGTCPGTNTDTTSPQPNTCNGDGDGLIEVWAGATIGTGTSNEVFRFWQHLALAGLIEGSYTGVTATPPGGGGVTYDQSYRSFTTPNIPKSKLANAGWIASTIPATGGSNSISDTTYLDGNYGAAFTLAGISAAGNTSATTLAPEEAWNIDTKVDDGKPALGIVKTRETHSLVASDPNGCTNPAGSTTVTMAAADYTLVNTGLNCVLIFNSGY
jgi:prepilin-type N-terminal cleavage/methylation domain-containing protein